MSHGSSPFFCPYCGDEGLRPYGETHGEWRCESCRRAFALRTIKQTRLPERPEAAISAGLPPGRLAEERAQSAREGSQRARGATRTDGPALAPGRLAEERAQ